MKNKRKMMSMIILVIAIVLVVFTHLNGNNSYEEKIINKPNKVTKGIALNLEQTEGAGDYKLVTQSNWPTEGYKFNSELSRCENGSELSWDDTKKTIVFSGNVSDKCYVYFDIYEEKVLLSDYVISQYTGTQGENGIYYHNAGLTNGAKDDSYRYAGANPNNYVCFGSNDSTCPNDNLYRIVSVKDGKVKLIKSDYANSNLLGTDGDYANSGNLYYWNKNTVNTWSACSLNKTNLNINYINNIGSDWSNKIAVTTWKVGGNTWDNIYSVTPSVVYQNEITNPDSTGSKDNATEYSAKIGLMYISDYGFAASPSAWTLAMSAYSNSTATSSNWLYKNTAEWPISRTSDVTRGSFLILEDGSVGGYGTNSAFAIRPVFNLEDSVVYKSGSGTSSDPIRINL